ncbi:ABC transporter ATP-binding protein [Schaalia suimastitidis]|uniref:ABC transporter ATP-binding protein n=1 Tax=Schaalia suimastitidis TaxID=121163 RepID=UPI0004088325|nr:ABC transporter ATP-binding protein [Schaalia suimastitidis]
MTQERTTLFSLLKPVRGSMALSVAGGFLAAFFGLWPAFALLQAAGAYENGTFILSHVWIYVAIIAAGFLGSHFLHKIVTGYAHLVESRYRRQLRERILAHVARLPLGWHTQETSGRLRSIIVEDVSRIHTLIAHFGADLGLGLGTPIVGFIFLFSLSWRYALVLLAWILIFLIVLTILMAGSQEGVNRDFMDAEKDLATSTVELVDGIATIKIFGLSGMLFGRFDDALRRYTNAAYRWMKGPGTPIAIISAALSPAGMLVPILGGAWFLHACAALSPTLLIPFLLVGVMLPVGLIEVTRLSHLIAMGNDAADSIGTLLDTPQLPEAEHPLRLPTSAPLGIEFDHVTFGYVEDAPPVLRDISLHLQPGAVTAIVGPSGSGKSTLIRLIARFWDVDAGSVRIGGVDIRQVSSYELLNAMGIVLQDDGCISATVADNIALGCPAATRDDVIRAAKRACIHERIEQLPHGYDTVLGMQGAHLSGGELQRLAIARAFLADPPILLLDEATAHADPHSERDVQRALGNLVANRTVVVIAHRLRTIVDADHIIVLNDGVVEEEGRHDALCAAGGLYWKMWEAQQ